MITRVNSHRRFANQRRSAEASPVSTDVAIVPMTSAHVDELMPYERQMFGSEAWTANGYRNELADTKRRYYLAAVDGQGALVGWAGVMILDETAEVLTVGVLPAARRRGVGTALLHGLLTEADRRGALEIFLEVRVDNDAAQAMYEREGFERVGIRPGYYDNGRVDAVVMRRET